MSKANDLIFYNVIFVCYEPFISGSGILIHDDYTRGYMIHNAE